MLQSKNKAVVTKNQVMRKNRKSSSSKRRSKMNLKRKRVRKRRRKKRQNLQGLQKRSLSQSKAKALRSNLVMMNSRVA